MDRYRLGKLIGRGGMAAVYEGWRRIGGGREQRVAVKRLLPELAADPEIITGLLVPVEARRYRTADEVLNALVHHDRPVASPRALARTVTEALALRPPVIEVPPRVDAPPVLEAAEPRPRQCHRRSSGHGRCPSSAR